MDKLAAKAGMDIETEAFPQQSHMRAYVSGLPSGLERVFTNAFHNPENVADYLEYLDELVVYPASIITQSTTFSGASRVGKILI